MEKISGAMENLWKNTMEKPGGGYLIPSNFLDDA